MKDLKPRKLRKHHHNAFLVNRVFRRVAVYKEKFKETSYYDLCYDRRIGLKREEDVDGTMWTAYFTYKKVAGTIEIKHKVARVAFWNLIKLIDSIHHSLHESEGKFIKKDETESGEPTEETV